MLKRNAIAWGLLVLSALLSTTIIFSSDPQIQYSFGQIKYLCCGLLVGTALSMFSLGLFQENRLSANKIFLVLGIASSVALLTLFLFLIHRDTLIIPSYSGENDVLMESPPAE